MFITPVKFGCSGAWLREASADEKNRIPASNCRSPVLGAISGGLGGFHNRRRKLSSMRIRGGKECRATRSFAPFSLQFTGPAPEVIRRGGVVDLSSSNSFVTRAQSFAFFFVTIGALESP